MTILLLLHRVGHQREGHRNTCTTPTDIVRTYTSGDHTNLQYTSGDHDRTAIHTLGLSKHDMRTQRHESTITPFKPTPHGSLPIRIHPTHARDYAFAAASASGEGHRKTFDELSSDAVTIKTGASAAPPPAAAGGDDGK